MPYDYGFRLCLTTMKLAQDMTVKMTEMFLRNFLKESHKKCRKSVRKEKKIE